MPLLYAVASRRCKTTSLSSPWKNRIPVADQNGHDRIAHVVGQSEGQAFSGYFITATNQILQRLGLNLSASSSRGTFRSPASIVPRPMMRPIRAPADSVGAGCRPPAPDCIA